MPGYSVHARSPSPTRGAKERRGGAVGPAQAPMTVEAVVARAEALCAALGRTLDARASTADYLAERGDLAAEAGQLAHLFP
ncbi:hypothetical protein ACFY2Z_29645 [Streptomyces sp. NPDC001222]|uniref:hypothetical protein n=1 Tax=Streptomyces sp. NPDC001222 TaxID=3364548 RepID=UPI0036AC5111